MPAYKKQRASTGQYSKKMRENNLTYSKQAQEAGNKLKKVEEDPGGFNNIYSEKKFKGVGFEYFEGVKIFRILKNGLSICLLNFNQTNTGILFDV